MMTMKQALEAAAKQFRLYEAHHREKVEALKGSDFPAIEAGMEKVERNAAMAEMCESVAAARPYQARVNSWLTECFGESSGKTDISERFDRLIEEVLEAAQAQGYDFSRVAQLVDYVASRPAGEIGQEFGGIAVTTFAAASACGVDFGAEAERELERISDPETMAKIRAKQAAKPSMSPLPQ